MDTADFPLIFMQIADISEYRAQHSSSAFCQPALPGSMASRHSGINAKFIALVVEVSGKLSSLINDQIPWTPIVPNPSLNHLPSHMFGLSVEHKDDA